MCSGFLATLVTLMIKKRFWRTFKYSHKNGKGKVFVSHHLGSYIMGQTTAKPTKLDASSHANRKASPPCTHASRRLTGHPQQAH